MERERERELLHKCDKGKSAHSLIVNLGRRVCKVCRDNATVESQVYSLNFLFIACVENKYIVFLCLLTAFKEQIIRYFSHFISSTLLKNRRTFCVF